MARIQQQMQPLSTLLSLLQIRIAALAHNQLERGRNLHLRMPRNPFRRQQQGPEGGRRASDPPGLRNLNRQARKYWDLGVEAERALDVRKAAEYLSLAAEAAPESAEVLARLSKCVCVCCCSPPARMRVCRPKLLLLPPPPPAPPPQSRP